jgi:acyl-CoA thioester hydrolase
MPSSELNLTVRPADLDKYQHVNYSVYMSWYERGHLQFLRQVGLGGFDGLERDYGMRTFIVNAKIQYLAELHPDDEVRLSTAVGSVGRTSMVYKQSINRNGTVASEAEMVAVFVDRTGKPTPIPDAIRAKLA